jgi:hypothetical protein
MDIKGETLNLHEELKGKIDSTVKSLFFNKITLYLVII